MLGGIPAEVFPLAVATAASPLPLVVLLVLLITPRAVPNGLAFTAGWAGALLVVSVVMVGLFASGAAPDEQSGVVTALEVVVGLTLVVLAVWQWRGRPRAGVETVVPGWLQLADRCTPRSAFVMGSVLVLANPKNLTLTTAVADAVAGTASGAGGRVPAVALFALLGSAGLAVPLVIRLTLGSRAVGMLTSWRRWLLVHGTPGACGLVALVGILLIARAVTH